MIRIDVTPLKEVNGVRFGTKRDEVREHFGQYEEFQKTSLSDIAADDFGYCHVYYDEHEQFEAIEIFKQVQVLVNGTLIFPTDIKDAMNVIDDFQKDDDGLLSISQSIAIYAPDDEMESILFAVEGYYEEHISDSIELDEIL